MLQVYANLALLLLNTVIPVVVMTTLNIKIYRTMRRFHKVRHTEQEVFSVILSKISSENM